MWAAAIAARRNGAEAVAGDRYACPMHPQVTTTTPSDCPICGMALEQVRGESSREPRAGHGRSPGALESNIGTVRLERVASAFEVLAWAESRNQVVAVVDNDDLNALPSEQVGFFKPSRRQEVRIPVRHLRNAVSPWGHSASRVTFRPAGAAPSFEPGEVGTLHFGPHVREAAIVPEAAIVHLPDGPHVLVVSDDRVTVTRRKVETGKTSSGKVFLLSGVGARDQIVTRNAFFFDADQRLRGTDSTTTGSSR